MFLNHEQIKLHNIIEGFTEKEFADASYNLTIGQIIDMDSKISDSFTLKPQGMVYVVFKEKLNVPPDILGFAHVKTTLTKRGIMATNIGIIDSNYNGYISTLLINFGKSDCFLTKGDTALRVTFSRITPPKVKQDLRQNNLTIEEYIKNTQKNIANLDEKFLNLNSVENNVEKSIRNTIVKFVVVFTVSGFLIASYFQFKNSNEKDLDRAIKKYETELAIVIENNNLLMEKLKTYEFKLKSLQDSLNLQKDLLIKIKK